MADRTFLDSNVLVYLFARDVPEKEKVVARILREGVAEGSLVISTQVMQEVYSVVTGKFKRTTSPEAAEKALLRMTEMHVVLLDPGLILAAAARCRKESANFWDALIVEAALKAGCTVLYSEDLQTGRDYGALRVVNPFMGSV